MTPEERKETLERVCALIDDGALTEDACRAEGITGKTLRQWVREDESARVRYTRARELAADALAEQAVGIATTGKGPDGVAYTDAQERRLAYDALRWLAGKRRPKEYGDRQSVDVAHTHRMLPPEERDAALSRIVARANLISPLQLQAGDEVVDEVDSQPE